MTYAPATIRAAAAYWVAHGGVNLGIVGDTGHVDRGVSYHLGADQLQPGAYSAQTARDKAGLTNAASALDLGRLDGSLTALRKFSVWLVDQARHNAPGTSDMREIIYTPDGSTVLRWDRQRGYSSAPRAGEADNTHLTHTHISWYRDAENRDHTAVFRPYFETPQEATPVNIYAKPMIAVVPAGAWVYDNPACSTSNGNVQVSPGREMPLIGKESNGNYVVGYVDTTPTEALVPERWMKPNTFTMKEATLPGGTPPPDGTPYSQADLDEARASGVAQGTETEQERIALAEANRIRSI